MLKADLIKMNCGMNSNKSRTLSFENRKNVARVALSPDSTVMISIDEGTSNSFLPFFKLFLFFWEISVCR
jgi:hypothetical protein